MLKKNPTLKVLLAGFVASLAMLALLYIAPYFGAPPLNIFGELSTISPAAVWWAAPLEFLVLGALIFPLIYSQLVYKDLNGPPWRRGLTWGIVLWIIRGIVVMPIMGQGFFSLQTPYALASIVETFLGHIIYGVLFGLLAGNLSAATVAYLSGHKRHTVRHSATRQQVSAGSSRHR